jgi:hypothetical protein
LSRKTALSGHASADRRVSIGNEVFIVGSGSIEMEDSGIDIVDCALAQGYARAYTGGGCSDSFSSISTSIGRLCDSCCNSTDSSHAGNVVRTDLQDLLLKFGNT